MERLGTGPRRRYPDTNRDAPPVPQRLLAPRLQAGTGIPAIRVAVAFRLSESLSHRGSPSLQRVQHSSASSPHGLMASWPYRLMASTAMTAMTACAGTGAPAPHRVRARRLRRARERRQDVGTRARGARESASVAAPDPRFAYTHRDVCRRRIRDSPRLHTQPTHPRTRNSRTHARARARKDAQHTHTWPTSMSSLAVCHPPPLPPRPGPLSRPVTAVMDGYVGLRGTTL